MATQIQTTVGEVRQASDRVIESTTRRLTEYEQKRKVAFAERDLADARKRLVEEIEYDFKLEAWKRLPFFVRWFNEAPRLYRRYGYGQAFDHLDESLKFEYDVPENRRLRYRATFLRDSMRGLDESTIVMLDAEHAIYIGLGDKAKVVEDER